MRPIGWIQVVGTLASSPDTEIASPSTGDNSSQRRPMKPTHATRSALCRNCGGLAPPLTRGSPHSIAA